MLLERDDPAINIVLASNATNTEVLAALFSKSKVSPVDHAHRPYLKSLRLAVLSNDVGQDRWLTKFPKRVVTEEDLTQLVKAGDDDEILALFGNALIDPDLLKTLYRGTGLFESVDWERRRMIVSATADNKRIATEYKSEYGDSDFARIHEELFGLLSVAPADFQWLLALDGLICSLNPFNLPAPKRSVIPILDRWKAVSDDAEGHHTELKWTDEFRCLIGALYGAHLENKDQSYGKVVDGLLASTDVAVRCAFYGKGTLDESSMDAGYEKDGAVYVFAAMNNQSMLLDPKLRNHFETDQFPSYDFSVPLFNRYRELCKLLHSTNPYPYFDPRPISERLNDAKKLSPDPFPNQQLLANEAFSAQLQVIEKNNEKLGKLLSRLQTTLIWVAVVLGALILVRG